MSNILNSPALHDFYNFLYFLKSKKKKLPDVKHGRLITFWEDFNKDEYTKDNFKYYSNISLFEKKSYFLNVKAGRIGLTKFFTLLCYHKMITAKNCSILYVSLNNTINIFKDMLLIFYEQFKPIFKTNLFEKKLKREIEFSNSNKIYIQNDIVFDIKQLQEDDNLKIVIFDNIRILNFDKLLENILRVNEIRGFEKLLLHIHSFDSVIAEIDYKQILFDNTDLVEVDF